jgi:hypothetical protein
MEGNQFQENEYAPAKLIEILLRRKWLITAGTLAAAVLLTVFVFLQPDVFKSNAVASLGEIETGGTGEIPKGLEIPVFTRYSNLYSNPDLLKEFLKRKNLPEEWDIDTDFFDTSVIPVYAFDEKSRVKKSEDSVLGVKITAVGPGAEEARDKAALLGEYIFTTILNDRLGKYIETLKTNCQTIIVRSNNNIISYRFEITNLSQKETLIEEQLLKIPGLGQKTERELVNVDENSEKYLSPAQQLVAVKMTVKEKEILIAQNSRNANIYQILLGYAEKAAAIIDKDHFFLVDTNLLNTLEEEKENYFSGKEDEESVVASNQLGIRFLVFENMKNTDYSFISGPTLPEKPFKPKRKRIVIAGTVLAFFAFVFLALVIEGWERGRKKIVPPAA